MLYLGEASVASLSLLTVAAVMVFQHLGREDW